MKKISLPLTCGLVISCFATLLIGCNKKADKEPGYFVDFHNNYLREDFIINDELKAKGNDIIYQTVEVEKDTLVAKPEDPTRRNYEFQGWYKENKCENAWDFESEKVTKNTKLFAKWGLSGKDEMDEPAYTPPSTLLEESAAEDYVINSIMNFKVNFNQLRVPTAGLLKLEANKDNVLPLMEYKVKASKTMTATYDVSEKKITVECTGNESLVIGVVDDSINYTLSNSTYEQKAKNYEAKAAEEESFHVMLAGSSSIEFWENSKEDLEPIVSYNHGIGGTTVEEWTSSLNPRLVYPYKPKMVVYYVGINNVINSKEDITTISNRLTSLFDTTHEALPDTKVQYILMNYLPNYSSYANVITSVNNAVIQYQASHSSWLTLINPGLALLKENGEPNAAYFRTDGLHLSHYGYIIWGEIIKESILMGLEAMQ